VTVTWQDETTDMADSEQKRPAILRYLALELVLLALAGSIYWYKVTHPDVAEPVPIMPIAVSDRTAQTGTAADAAARTLPVDWDATSQGQGLILTTAVSRLTPKALGATYHLEATLENRTTDKELRQLRLVLECLSADGERIGVDSFEPLSPSQPSLKPGGRHAFAMTSAIDPRTARIRLLVHVRDEAPVGS
jgi:hypothetical protein